MIFCDAQWLGFHEKIVIFRNFHVDKYYCIEAT